MIRALAKKLENFENVRKSRKILKNRRFFTIGSPIENQDFRKFEKFENVCFFENDEIFENLDFQ